MTGIDGRTTRRINWSLRTQVNRMVFALIVGWIGWLVAQRPSEWLIIPAAVVVYAAVTLVFMVRDRRYAGTDRQL